MKGFTLVELLGVIILVGVLALTTVSISTGVIENNRNRIYQEHESNLQKAAMNYVISNEIILPAESSESLEISVEELYDSGYISRLEDSRSRESCSGYVEVSLNSNNVITYVPYIFCGDHYQTEY